MRCWRRGKAVAHAEGYHAGTVFPRRYGGPPAGPPHQDLAGGAVYHGAVLRQGRGDLRHHGGGAGGVRAHFQGRTALAGAGSQARAVHYRFHRPFESAFHTGRPLSGGVGLPAYLRYGRAQRGVHGHPHHAAHYGHVPFDLYHQPHPSDGCAGAAHGRTQAVPCAGARAFYDDVHCPAVHSHPH